MANAGPNTNGSQFFIVHGADVGLPPNYTIFGMLTGGGDVLDTLANSPVDPQQGRREFLAGRAAGNQQHHDRRVLRTKTATPPG